MSFRSGSGVNIDLNASLLLLQKAASGGEPRAFYELSAAYEIGIGVARNPDMATKYRLRSAPTRLSPGHE